MDFAVWHRAAQTEGIGAIADGFGYIAPPAVFAKVVSAGSSTHGGSPVLLKADVALHLQIKCL